jgi:hypothetical protein
MKEFDSWTSVTTFMESVRYASANSAIVIQAFFAAAQINGAYEGEQRTGNALISRREFRLATHGVWRWVYATRAVLPSKTQTILWRIVHSIENSVPEDRAKVIHDLASQIAGRVCALVRIVPDDSTLLINKGLVCAPGASFYRFAEVHALEKPIPVHYLIYANTGKPKWATRYLAFGKHVKISVRESASREAMRGRFPWMQPLIRKQNVQYTL